MLSKCIEAVRGCLARRSRAAAFRMAVAAGAVALVSACGGGSNQVEEFAPGRVIAFGDEHSLLLPDGRKYSVAYVDEDGAVDCNEQKIWVQVLATSYGLAFSGCNPDNLPEDSLMLAEVGATIADFQAQVNGFLDDGGTFRDDDLVTVLVGLHDVLELYGRYPAESRESLIEQARERGEAWAKSMNAIAEAGARVLVVNSPDVGLTPFAAAETAANTDFDRAGFLSDLTKAMNVRMASTIIPDGRLFGIVFADDFTRAAVRSPASFGMINATSAACVTALPDCTNNTLVAVDEDETDPTGFNYLWADDLRIGAGAQLQIGNTARDRIDSLPF